MSATITAPLAALTTVFTPPCSISWLLTSTKNPSQYPPFPTTGSSSCDPPKWTAIIQDRGFQYYSPAICPSGFEVGEGCQITKTRAGEGFPTIQAGETAVYCVPSGQTCTTDTTDFRGGVWGATSLDGKFTVGPAIQIRFQQSDLSLLETHPLTPGLSLTSTTLTAASATDVSATTSRSTTAGVDRFTTVVAAPSATYTRESLTSSTSSSFSSSRASTTLTEASATSSDAAVAQNTAPIALNSNENNSTAMQADVAAIVVSTLIAVFAVFFVLAIRIRNRRDVYRQRFERIRWPWKSYQRKPKGLIPVGLGAWIGTRGSQQYSRYTRHLSPEPLPSRQSTADWGTEAGPPVLTLELGKQPLANPENPAEAETEQDATLFRRASWVSRMLSMMTRSSITTGSSSLSRWTQRSLAVSGDYEKLILPRKTEQTDLLPDTNFLTVPEATYSRPTTMSSATTNGDKVLGRANSMWAMPKMRSFDRLSQGTFGKVTVRAHSYHSTPGSNAKSLDDS